MTPFVPPEIAELLEVKRTAERQELTREQATAWRVKLAAAIEAVDAASTSSVLPADPPPAALGALDRWLRDVRRRFW